MAAGEDDTRGIVHLLVEQVEFADVIVVNKTDLVSKLELATVLAAMKTLNPVAHVIATARGQVPLRQILDTKRFDFTRAQNAPGWVQALSANSPSESETYGVSSFVYRAKRPFHPARFFRLIMSKWPGVIRSKGFFWLATRMADMGFWSLAGESFSLSRAGSWWATVPRERWPQDEAAVARTLAHWDNRFGDRRQELVIIGIEMPKDQLVTALDACLLTSDEMQMGEAAWCELEDPLPSWELPSPGNDVSIEETAAGQS
jgi:G3E family GTPase